MSTPCGEPAARLAAAVEPELFKPAFVSLLAVQMSFGFAFSTFFLLPKYLATELRVGPEAVGHVAASAMIAAVLAVPLLGRAIDRHDRRLLILAGTLVTALCALLFIPIHEVGIALFALRALQGVAMALVFNAGATLVTDLAPPAHMGRALGYFGLSSLVTNAAAPAIGEHLATHVGWASVFVFGAAAAAVSALFALRLPRSPSLKHELPSSAPRHSRALLEVLYAAAVVGVAFGTMFTFCVPFALALGERAVSGLFLGYTISAASVRLALGGFADRVGRRKVAVFALLVYAAALFATIALKPGWLFGLGLLLGLGHGLVYPALNAIVIEGVHQQHRGKVMALFNGCFNAGVALSTLGLGSLAEHAGYRSTFATAGAVTLSAAALLAKKSSADTQLAVEPPARASAHFTAPGSGDT